MHLDASKLVDINAMVNLCTDNMLLSAGCFLCTAGLGDYVLCLRILRAAMTASTDEFLREQIGYKIMLLLSSTFAGRLGFGTGTIPAVELPWARASLCRALFDGDEKYEILTSLVQLNAIEMLSVFAVLFGGDAEFDELADFEDTKVRLHKGGLML